MLMAAATSSGRKCCCIDRLPDETIENIFLLCVRKVIFTKFDSTPSTVLAAVCYRWRQIAFNCGRLWATIHMQYPKQAESFVTLSQDADLQVSFSRPMNPKQPFSPDEARWIWSHAHRIVTLDVLEYAHRYSNVLARSTADMRNLRKLCLEYVSFDFLKKANSVVVVQGCRSA